MFLDITILVRTFSDHPCLQTYTHTHTHLGSLFFLSESISLLHPPLDGKLLQCRTCDNVGFTGNNREMSNRYMSSEWMNAWTLPLTKQPHKTYQVCEALSTMSVTYWMFNLYEIILVIISITNFLITSFFLYKFILFIYFWVRWVFVAVRGLSLVVASRGYSLLQCAGFSLRWFLLLRSMGSRHVGFSNCGTWAQ